MTNEVSKLNKIVSLPVCPVTQVQDFDCGKAAVKTLFKTMGIELEEKILQAILRTNEASGTPPKNILQALRFAGLEFVEMLGSTVSDIENKIKEGYYCLVVYQAWGSPEEHKTLESGHYSLAYGYDDSSVHLADPWVREESMTDMGIGLRKLPKSDFDQDWRDLDYQGNMYDHWMVAVKANGQV